MLEKFKMSLATYFNAAAAGVVLAPPATPMKMLPLHNAPPVQRRPSTHASFTGVCVRSLDADTWLLDVTANREIGRVLSNKSVDATTTAYETTHGRFDVRNGLIVRGRIDGVALWGHAAQTQDGLPGWV